MNSNDVQPAAAENDRASDRANSGATAVESVGSSDAIVPVDGSRSWRLGDEGVYRQARQDSRTMQPVQPVGETTQTCLAQFEAAVDVEVFVRADRKITGVWRVVPTRAASCRTPDYIISDVNGCLYGSTGDVWEPLDCPGSGFLSEGRLPGTSRWWVRPVIGPLPE